MITYNNFSCCYKVKGQLVPALDRISFSVADGELFVIAGESGCGKSTLLRCVLGQAEYTQGSLLIDGMTPEEYRVSGGSTGYVRQEADLYPHMTIYENIAFPLRMMHTAQAEIDQRVKALAEELEIRLLLTRKPRQLSGGQQQRVAIARALIKQPPLLLLDEPFSNIDPALRMEFRCLLRELHQRLQTTILFVTHDLGEAFSLADRLLILENGHVADIGTPASLLQEHHSALLKGYLK